MENTLSVVTVFLIALNLAIFAYRQLNRILQEQRVEGAVGKMANGLIKKLKEHENKIKDINSEIHKWN